MKDLRLRLQSALIALVVLGLSAGLTFGAQPPAAQWGLSNAASHAGKTVPVADEELDENEDGDEDADEAKDEETTEEEDAEEAGENCSTDPTTLDEAALAELRHGSVACWAAHQTEWPEWFENHGAFVRCWAHSGKPDAPSCTEAPVEADAATTSHGNGKGKGQAKGKNKAD